MPSRFLREIPSEVKNDITVEPFTPRGSFTRSNYGSGNPIGSHNLSSSAAHKFGQVNAKAESTGEEYNAGDTVRHKTFGTGVILSSMPMGGDVLLEIAFDKAGTKKLMANYAKLEKV